MRKTPSIIPGVVEETLRYRSPVQSTRRYSKTDPINKISYKQMLEYYNKINFEEGTIKPKILAALRFIEHGGEKVYITSISNIENMESGTVIDRN